ncbi:uncharacterized protein LOC134450742 isoform X2 [Engraulis encrasicolus]|uniref:uncharacterized protein LOC134450742 isoform X2 n=1 Tax=Engraulis encrasicolus TaxID=184585 RepID=UPI002FCF0D21
MVNFCAVRGCSNRSGRDKLSYYCLPKIPAARYTQTRRDLYKKRREKWLRRIRREDLFSEDCTKNLNIMRVCSDHFISEHSATVAETLPPALENVGREETVETKTSGDGCTSVGNLDEHCTNCIKRVKEINQLREENRRLKRELSRKALHKGGDEDKESKFALPLKYPRKPMQKNRNVPTVGIRADGWKMVTEDHSYGCPSPSLVIQAVEEDEQESNEEGEDAPVVIPVHQGLGGTHSVQQQVASRTGGTDRWETAQEEQVNALKDKVKRLQLALDRERRDKRRGRQRDAGNAGNTSHQQRTADQVYQGQNGQLPPTNKVNEKKRNEFELSPR